MINAFVLHKQAYRETSLLVDFITPEFGRVSTVYKGARKKKAASYVEPFQRYRISWAGRTDLKVLTQLDTEQAPMQLTAEYLFSGLYLNELLYYVLPLFDENPDVFVAYEQALMALLMRRNLESHLRHFELQLLTALGYALSFDVDCENHQALTPDLYYQYLPGRGFIPAAVSNSSTPQFLGETLLRIAQGQWNDPAVLQALKFINRAAIAVLLKGRTLKSRQYFSARHSR